MNKSGADAAACEFSNNAEIPSAGMDTFMRTCDQTAHYVCAAVKYGYRLADTAIVCVNKKAVGFSDCLKIFYSMLIEPLGGRFFCCAFGRDIFKIPSSNFALTSLDSTSSPT